VFVAGPGVEILDLVGPLQVFARASEMHARENPGSPPIYSVEVATVSSSRSLIANCGVRITADRTFREVRGKIDTLLVAGGDAIEQNDIDAEAVRWLKRISPRIRRVGSVCTGAMLLARAGLLDGRRATTHWNWCQTLIKRAPRARRCDPIFVRDENVYTSAGVTAGMDLALALVEEITVRASLCRLRAIWCFICGARRPIAIQRRVITATDRSKTIARIGGMGAR
jgi:Transcriptional regulator containing an amidase domain and an AraC-type DNA-binding HTH domain